MNISGKTRYIGILGYPIGHSLSPAMQNKAFKFCEIDNVYLPLEVKPEDLSLVVKSLSKLNFDGFNVTAPHKVEIIKYLDEIDEFAKIIGAVNTVVIKEGKTKGYNTDGKGFLRALEENANIQVKGKKIFILGAGGAARSIAVTMAVNGAEKIYICNRTYEKAVKLSNMLNNNFTKICKPIPMEPVHMKKAIDESDILVNSTVVGMYPNVENSPIDKSLLHKDLVVYDIVYNPKKTKLLKDAEAIGCKTLSGLWMLVYQGAEAFEMWTGKKAPVKLMYDTVNEILK